MYDICYVYLFIYSTKKVNEYYTQPSRNINTVSITLKENAKQFLLVWHHNVDGIIPLKILHTIQTHTSRSVLL